MHLEILTPEAKLFDGEISGILMPGIEGSFELLNNHAPIISALAAGKIRINTSEGAKYFEVESGFVECLNNHVVVLVEGGEKV